MKKSVVPGENHQTAESKRQVHMYTLPQVGGRTNNLSDDRH